MIKGEQIGLADMLQDDDVGYYALEKKEELGTLQESDAAQEEETKEERKEGED